MIPRKVIIDTDINALKSNKKIIKPTFLILNKWFKDRQYHEKCLKPLVFLNKTKGE